jgi:hypothetical protein
MGFQREVGQALDYGTYRFGRARQLYRGPKPDLSQPYVACIGGSETFGKFVQKTYAAFLEERVECTVANFGTPSGGPGFFLKDPVLLEALSNARVCVIQTMNAYSNSNRMYSVRKRRNERLQGVSEVLRLLYPDVDLLQFRYVHNLLARLYMLDAEKFRLVELELRAAWIARMRELCDQIETRKILFWFSERQPEEPTALPGAADRMACPALVDRQMIEAVRPMVDAVVEYVAGPGNGSVLRLDQAEVPAALAANRAHPSPRMHAEAAEALEAAVRRLGGFGEG